MRRYLMLFFISASGWGFASCSSAYRSLTPVPGETTCLDRLSPASPVARYTVRAEIRDQLFSGTMIRKIMADSSTRVVFTNGMGMTFFDFGFGPGDQFTVYRIIDPLNREAVIRTLRKDLELIWLLQGSSHERSRLGKDSLEYYRIRRDADYFYYVTKPGCGEVQRMERASSRKPVTIAFPFYRAGELDSVKILHKKIDFTIGLKKYEDASQ